MVICSGVLIQEREMDYKKLFKDLASGDFDPSKFTIVMDNDCGYWRCTDDSLDDDSQEELTEKMEEKYGCPDGYRDVVDILLAAGIDSQWC